MLCGARQTGKTSLLRHLFPGHSYLTLDEPGAAAQATESPELFLDALPAPAILDEIQYAPSLFRHLKLRIDRDPAPGSYLLTGSQEFPLMQGVAESLAGRCAILRLQTLSYREIAAARGDGTDPVDAMLAGGYPALWRPPEVDRDLWFGSYLATCLERDVRNLLRVGNLRDFDRFLRALAARTGQTLSYSDLARDTGVAVSTARAWFGVLEAAGHVYTLDPYHRNIGQRIAKTPKIAFSDTGLALHLSGVRDRAALLATPRLGDYWESFVVGECRRALLSRGRTPNLWFWRNHAGSEVDLVEERGGRVRLFEIKFSERPEPADLRGAAAFRRAYGDDAVEAVFVICRVTRRHSLGDRAFAIPIQEAHSLFEP